MAFIIPTPSRPQRQQVGGGGGAAPAAAAASVRAQARQSQRPLGTATTPTQVWCAARMHDPSQMRIWFSCVHEPSLHTSQLASSSAAPRTGAALEKEDEDEEEEEEEEEEDEDDDDDEEGAPSSAGMSSIAAEPARGSHRTTEVNSSPKAE